MTVTKASRRIAVVTGATGGIGRAIAIELADAGYDVVVHGFRNEKAAAQMVAEIEDRGLRATAILGDLNDPEARSALARKAWRWQERVDLWVNNAGADILTGSLKKASFDEKLDALLTTDLIPTLHLSRAIGEFMKQQGSGVIINIGWDGAARGMAGDSAQLFAAAKGGIEAFSRSLAQTLAPEVRVHCVAPGWIKTDWGENASEHWQERARRESLSGRWGTPEDVARVIRFLASDDASFLSGQTIDVNGGFRFPE